MFNIAANLLQQDWGDHAGRALERMGERKREEALRNQLAEALPRAVGGDQNALSSVYSASPELGYRVQAGAQEQQRLEAAAHEKARDARLQQFGSYMANMDDAQLQQHYPGEATKLLSEFPELGSMFDANYDDSVRPWVNSLAGIKPETPNPTSSQLEYVQYANEERGAGRTPLPFIDYQERLKKAAAPIWQPPSGYTGTPAGLEPIKGGPADPATKVKEPKPLPNKVIDDLAKRSGAAETMERLVNTFKDEYGGNWAMGGLENKARLLVGDDTGQGQWWQDYAMEANQMRNDLFGSALTAPEKAAFEAATITPGMDSGEIKKNLARQKAAADKALQKLVGASRANWKNDEAIEAATGGRGFNAPAPTQGGATVLNWDELP